MKFWPIICLNSKKGSLTQFAALDQDLLKTLDQALTSDELTGENAMEKAQQLYHMCKKWWKFSFCKFLLKVLVFFWIFFLNFFLPNFQDTKTIDERSTEQLKYEVFLNFPTMDIIHYPVQLDGAMQLQLASAWLNYGQSFYKKYRKLKISKN